MFIEVESKIAEFKPLIHIPELVSSSLGLRLTQSFHLPGIPSKGMQPGRAAMQSNDGSFVLLDIQMTKTWNNLQTWNMHIPEI